MSTNINFNKRLGVSGGTNITLPSSGDTASMIWTITTPANNHTFKIESNAAAGFNNYDIDWGDGSSESGITIGNKTHVYATAGLYEIKVIGDIYIMMSSATTAHSSVYTEWKQWGTNAKVTGFREWFYRASNMAYTATDAPTFDLKVSASYWGPYRSFFNCDGITSLDLSGWDVSSLQNIGQSTFQSMNNLAYLNISNWNLSGITSWANGISSVGSSVVGGCELIAPNVKLNAATSLSSLFLNSAFKSMNVNNWTLNPTSVNLNQMFKGVGGTAASYYGLIDLDLSTWNNIGSNIVSNLALWFYSARGIKTLNISNWDLRHVTDFRQCFYQITHCEYIEGLNEQRWDSATSLSDCFENTFKLKFDTHNFHNDFGSSWSVTTFTDCFRRNGFTNAVGDRGVFPNIANWDMSNAVSVSSMLREARYNGTSTFAPSTSWDLSNVTSLSSFAYAHVGIQVWDWSNVTIASTMTNISLFVTYVSSGSSPQALSTMIFGSNCNFSGVTTWANFAKNRVSLTTLTFDSAVSFAATTSMATFANAAPLSTASYDALLIRLDATNNNNSVVLYLNLAQYTLGSAAETSRTQLVTNQSWTITDAGGV